MIYIFSFWEEIPLVMEGWLKSTFSHTISRKPQSILRIFS